MVGKFGNYSLQSLPLPDPSVCRDGRNISFRSSDHSYVRQFLPLFQYFAASRRWQGGMQLERLSSELHL